MFRDKKIVILTLVVLVLMVAWVTAAGAVEQKGVLAGRVLAQGLVTPGTIVHEGDVLVFVDTITGPSPAVRATTDGRVNDILVKPGDSIKTGDVLARIEPARK
jgi:biotin carboxyl carrier protein